MPSQEQSYPKASLASNTHRGGIVGLLVGLVLLFLLCRGIQRMHISCKPVSILVLACYVSVLPFIECSSIKLHKSSHDKTNKVNQLNWTFLISFFSIFFILFSFFSSFLEMTVNLLVISYTVWQNLWALPGKTSEAANAPYQISSQKITIHLCVSLVYSCITVQIRINQLET